MRRALSLLLLVLVSVALLPACQGLASALGVQPAATAPVFNGVGIVAQPGAEVWVDGVSPDQSGNVAAKGDGAQTSDQRQVTQIDPAAVAKGIAEAATVVVPGGRAAKALAAAEAALEGGDVARADKLVRAAKGFADAEKPAEDAQEEPAAPAIPATPAPAAPEDGAK